MSSQHSVSLIVWLIAEIDIDVVVMRANSQLVSIRIVTHALNPFFGVIQDGNDVIQVPSSCFLVLSNLSYCHLSHIVSHRQMLQGRLIG